MGGQHQTRLENTQILIGIVSLGGKMPPKWDCNHSHILTKNWGGNQKRQAREDTIIGPYREKYGWSVPHGLQYWTLCGLSVKDGKLVPGCELDHMVSVGLITPDQFYGVEVQKSIYDQNRQIDGPNWFLNKMNQEVTNHNVDGNFKPAIVNFDMINYPNNCATEFSALMLVISRLKHPVMLVGNFVLKAWLHERKDPDFIIDELNKEPQLKEALSIANWEYNQLCYEYRGADKKSNSIMGTIILHKK